MLKFGKLSLTFCPLDYRLDVSENGLAAVVRLSNGDMRKALNILQVIIPLLRCFFFVYLCVLLFLLFCFCYKR